MGKWIRLCLVVVVLVAGLAVTACGRGRAYRQTAGRTANGDTMMQHHSLIKGALVGAAAGHMAGHHAVVGAITGAIVQHERNKHQRR